MPEFVQAASGAREPDFAPLLSVVVPVRNEEPSILPLVGEIRRALAGRDFEIVYVDDGSLDATAARLREASGIGAPLRWLRHRRSCGQSAAIVTGVRAAAGQWIATLDGDGQNDPADIPVLLEAALALGAAVGNAGAGGPVLVAGHRTRRSDAIAKRLPSRVANGVRARLLGDRTPDTGCGLKLFRREAFLDLPRFDHMHRFLPALFLRAAARSSRFPSATVRGSAAAPITGPWTGLASGFSTCSECFGCSVGRADPRSRIARRFRPDERDDPCRRPTPRSQARSAVGRLARRACPVRYLALLRDRRLASANASTAAPGSAGSMQLHVGPGGAEPRRVDEAGGGHPD